MSDQTAADLRAAADVLERDGWTQGSWRTDSGCYCAVGAIEAVTGQTLGHGRVNAAYDALWRVTGEDGPIMWNDRHGRTAAEVIAALRAAADTAESEPTTPQKENNR